MTTPTAPKTEIGYAGLAAPGWGAWIAPEEEVAALRWPGSVGVYHKMRTDSQVDALLKGVTWPIRRRRYRLNPNGARDEVVEQIATDLAVPIRGAEDLPLRGRKRFSHDDHLRHALLALVYGHMFMEQSGVVDDDLNWRLRKLAPRMPHSISKIDVARDGGLVSITQHGNQTSIFNREGVPPIPVSQLVAYVWEREGANWTGRSMLRSVYRHWLVKDRMIRIDALKNERYGLGIPTGTAPPGAKDTAVYGELAQGIRAGERSGVGLPNGATLGVQGVTGALPDTLGTIRMHDEAMARAFLQAWQQLGTTQTGSRAVGETFMDFHMLALDTVIDWYLTITNEHVIEDQVDWNFGPDEAAPLLEVAPLAEDETEPLATADLVTLIDKGLLAVDDELEGYIRDRHGLPAAGDNPRPTVTLVPPVAARRDRPVAAASQTATTATVGHRAPNEVEAAAQTDFEEMQREWQTETEAVVAEWAAIREEQIAALVVSLTAAVEAGSPTALATVQAPVLGADVIEARMMTMLERGYAAAANEAALQGVVVSYGDVELLRPVVRSRAQATAVLLARSLSDSAVRNAVMRYGAELAADVVADAVAVHLRELSTAYLLDTLGGALTQAQNTGRRVAINETISNGGRPARVYASELLDGNTCANCAAVDGREYATMAEAEADYPTGGHAECLGGPRCRGTLVAVYDESPATT